MTTRPIHAQASHAILGCRIEIAAVLVQREFALHPELEQRYGKIGREKSIQDAGFHLSFLAQALALNSPAVFIDYVAWAKVMLSQRKVLPADLAFHLECLAEVLHERLPADLSIQAIEFVKAAVQAMPAMPENMPTFLHEGEKLAPLAHQYFEAMRRGDRQLASRMVIEAVAAGTSVKEIYLHVFQPAQREIGRLWQINRITVAQEHYCTAATQLIMSQLYPQIFASTKNGRVLIASCVAGDLHEIGVRMVADFFEMDGWNTFYLGANTPHESVISTIVERHADVLAVSATISYHVDAVRDLISAVRQHPATGRVKILAGGYPFNRDVDLWRQVGADGSAFDAQQAITLANQLVNGTVP
jgi:MerR family transcriptional regulator, light-induced transcriptional regulator